jgi:hypothetical protein
MWGFIQINSQHDSIKTIPTLNDRIFFFKKARKPNLIFFLIFVN